MKKYIFVTGGVCSSLGKGLASASIGALLEGHGIKVCMVKIDPYLNVDAGTMSPYQHGEVYVTDDGAETDLDLGNYYRFTSSPVGLKNTITTGQIYQEVIRKEREGKYLGRTVQMIPHITDEIKRRIVAATNENEAKVTIIEVGGTVGDLESVPFLEASRQFVNDMGKENVLFIHLTLVPLVAGEELKTKPTQHSVKELREIGIQPDILLCRGPEELTEEMKKKISLFTNVEKRSVFSAYDVDTTVYEIPLIYREQGLHLNVMEKLGLTPEKPQMAAWEKFIRTFHNSKTTVRIGMLGKYLNLTDSYKSINEALFHGAIANGARVEIVKIDSEEIEEGKKLEEAFKDIDGILIPGGFGKRGIEGMLTGARYAREKRIPCLGICLGMQIMVIEYARNVAGLKGANSTEFNPETVAPVVSLLEEQMDVKEYGGTMRLGRSESHLKDGTKIREAYGSPMIFERHRHRYEVSVRYRDVLEEAGLMVSGVTPGNSLVESVQWPDHPWSTGVQFHPEFTSKPTAPNPLFAAFIKASLAGRKKEK
ncbi:MAG: CTP synthase [Spirochaetales bacterium]|nr:CTP synthase [Spirochaetales bacterium]